MNSQNPLRTFKFVNGKIESLSIKKDDDDLSKITSRDQLINAKLNNIDFKIIKSRMNILPEGTYDIRAMGIFPHAYTEHFLTLTTIDGKLWIIDDKNDDFIIDFVSKISANQIKSPFPCVISYSKEGILKFCK